MPVVDRVVVVHDFIEMRGGAAVLARLSATQYSKLGIEVVYISGDRDDGSLSTDRIETVGLNQDSLLSLNKYTALTRGIFNQNAAKAVADWIRENDTPTTAYHLHNWSQILSPSIFKALEPVSERTVVSCHDLFNICPNGGLLHYPTNTPCSLKPMSANCWLSQCDRRNAAQKYWRMIRQLNLNRVAKFSSSKMTFVCLHAGMEALMRSVGFSAPNLTSIPNPAMAYTQDRIKCEDNRPFLFVGRLTAEKGVDIALAEAKRAGVPMIIVGSGDLEESLRAQYKDAVFAGFCDHSEIVKYAQQSRAIIVPSRVREPFGLVVGEGALSGLPILISEQSMLSSRVKQLEIGDSFNTTESGSLARVLAEWAGNDELIEGLSKNAIANANKICSSPESWTRQFVELMQSKLDAAGAR